MPTAPPAGRLPSLLKWYYYGSTARSSYKVLWRCATTILSNPLMILASVYKNATFVSLRTSKDKYCFMEFEKINAAPTNKPPLPPHPSYANTLKVRFPILRDLPRAPRCIPDTLRNSWKQGLVLFLSIKLICYRSLPRQTQASRTWISVHIRSCRSWGTEQI